jgi:large subunit ribosomal protein L21
VFAIVDIAGFQEKVQEGDVLQVPRLDAEKGKKMTFGDVLLLADGDNLTIGGPLVGGAMVEAEVVDHVRGDKIRVVKFRRRKRRTNVKGHRQDYTTIKITGIRKK